VPNRLCGVLTSFLWKKHVIPHIVWKKYHDSSPYTLRPEAMRSLLTIDFKLVAPKDFFPASLVQCLCIKKVLIQAKPGKLTFPWK
jgi:hypothetical protein